MPLANPQPLNASDILASDLARTQHRDVQTSNEQTLDNLVFGPVSAVVGAADTILQSVTSDSFVDENTVKKWLTNLNQPLGDFYRQNEDASKAVGEIVSSLVPAIAATKVIRAGSYVDKLLGKVKHGDLLRKFTISSGKTRADRIKNLEQEAKLFVKNKSLTISDEVTPTLTRAIRGEKLGAAADSLKESVAANAAIVALYNDSDVFFPDELSAATNFALFAVPEALFAVGAWAFTGTAIKRHLQSSLAQGYAEALNPAGLPTSDVLSRAGFRGDKAAVHAVDAQVAAADLATKGNTQELKTSGAARVQSARQDLREELVNMGNDDIFGHGISHKVGFDKASPELENLARVSEDDPTLLVPATSIEKLTESVQASLPKSIEKRLESLRTQIAESDITIREAGEDAGDLIKQRDELAEEFKRVDGIHSVVVETDGTLTPTNLRKFSVLDVPETVGISEKQVLGERFFQLTPGETAKLDLDIGTTVTGKIQLTPVEVKGKILGDINTTRVLSQREIGTEFEENMLLNLRDISIDWHFNTGKRGKDVFNNLRPELRAEIENWTGSSGSSQLRQWIKDGDPRGEELITAYREAGLHRRLHELADENGTIPLYRGEAKKETANPTNDVVSMASDPKFAERAFAGGGKNVIRRDVPVDDVIMVVGGIGGRQEFELIVKGNTRRNKQSVGAVQTAALEAQTFDQRAATWVLQQRALDKFRPAVDPTVYVHPGSSYMELDFASELIRKFPDQEVVRFASNGTSNAADLERIQFSSLQKKFTEYQKDLMLDRAAKKGMLKLSAAQQLSNYDRAKMLNLPSDTAGGRHPLMSVFDELTPAIGGEIRDLRSFFSNMGELKAAMVKHIDEGKLGESLHADLKLGGNSLRHDKTDTRKASVLLATSKYAGRIGPDQIAERIFAQKTWQNDQLLRAQENNAPVVAGIVQELFSRKEAMELATSPQFIIEGTQAGVGVLTTQSFAVRNNPVLKTLDTMVDLSNKRALSITKQVFDEQSVTFNKLFSANNAASLDTLNIAINGLRQGWKLLDEPVEISAGKWAFVLDDKSSFNSARYKELFGTSFEEAAELNGGQVFMPVRASVKVGSGDLPTPTVVDNLALQGMQSVTSISHQFLDNLNHLRKVRKLPPIPKKAWHVPAVDISEGSNLYLVDGAGKVEQTINAATFGESMRIAKQEISNLPEGRTLGIVDEDTVMQYHDSLGDIWQNPRNFSFSELQTGAAKGRTGSRTIVQGEAPLDSLIKSLQANFQLLTRHTHATIFESELNFAKSAIQANVLQPELKKKGKQLLMQQYERIALQRSALNSNGYVGRFYYAVEGVADDMFRSAWDKLHAVKTPTAAATQKEFDRIDNALGEYNPFKSVTELLESSTPEIKIPPTFRGAVTGLNKFTTDMVLRIADMGMPLINFASLASVTPAVMSALRRGKGESVDDWKQRISIIGSPIDNEQAISNPMRMVMNGLDGFFSPDSARIRKLASERGYLKQEVAERLNLWTSPRQGWMARNRDNVIDKLSIPTDWSENMSRDISFMMMYRTGKKTFGLDDEAAMLFAHSHANQIVGDYRPTNRPQMFQGATGMPLGLFTTWAVNWLQRVFGDVEAGRAGAAFWQAGVQTFMFGAESLPGVSHFIDTFMTSYNGKENVVDAFDNRFGHTFSDAFFQGSLSSLTGIAIQSRADVTLPTVFSGAPLSQAIPGASVMSTLYEGLSEGFKSVRQNGGFNGREMSEIISVYGVNGAVKNLFQVMQGQAVDRHGALITEDVRSFENILPRLFELKSIREERKARELQRDRMQQEVQRSHLDRLSKQLRSAVRGRSVDRGLLESGLMDYYKAGGSPSDFKRYLRQQVLISVTEKSSRKLLEALKKSDEQGQAMRLMRLQMDDNL
jgi:hypothetical protein